LYLSCFTDLQTKSEKIFDAQFKACKEIEKAKDRAKAAKTTEMKAKAEAKIEEQQGIYEVLEKTRKFVETMSTEKESRGYSSVKMRRYT
jgi:hypothetical protein